MPTKKPTIQAVVEKEIKEKLKYIANKEIRTESQMASYIITKYVDQYEKEHGKIKIEKE